MIPHMCMNHSNISYNRIQFLNKTKDPKKREQVSTTSTSRENGEERKTKYM